MVYCKDEHLRKEIEEDPERYVLTGYAEQRRLIQNRPKPEKHKSNSLENATSIKDRMKFLTKEQEEEINAEVDQGGSDTKGTGSNEAKKEQLDTKKVARKSPPEKEDALESDSSQPRESNSSDSKESNSEKIIFMSYDKPQQKRFIQSPQRHASKSLQNATSVADRMKFLSEGYVKERKEEEEDKKYNGSKQKESFPTTNEEQATSKENHRKSPSRDSSDSSGDADPEQYMLTGYAEQRRAIQSRPKPAKHASNSLKNATSIADRMKFLSTSSGAPKTDNDKEKKRNDSKSEADYTGDFQQVPMEAKETPQKALSTGSPAVSKEEGPLESNFSDSSEESEHEKHVRAADEDEEQRRQLPKLQKCVRDLPQTATNIAGRMKPLSAKNSKSKEKIRIDSESRENGEETKHQKHLEENIVSLGQRMSKMEADIKVVQSTLEEILALLKTRNS
jgi:hypothetical protein